MKIYTSYSVKIKDRNHIFKDTVSIYRSAVDFFIGVINKEWDDLKGLSGTASTAPVERLTVATGKRPLVKYDFAKDFYKFPCYLRRAAIAEAYGKVSSYRSNLENWNKDPVGRKPRLSSCGHVYPAMYRDNMFVRKGTYTARVKVYVRNTWDWLDVTLKKSDVDYIERHCRVRKECVPTLRKRGKKWSLDFAFEENVKLNDTSACEQTILAVDLGINNAATISVMRPDGTILGREFLSLPREQDCLTHSIGRIKKAQSRGNYKTPRLWAKAKGINHDIAVKTAQFIVDTAIFYNADVIVFEHLDRSGKKKGTKKQKLHMWKCNDVQSMVTVKAHRLGIRIRHINAWGTSRLAYDGSGHVLRGTDGNLSSYSICRFKTGKIYNCDLNATYNIGARYFIREILKSCSEKKRLQLEAKVPQACKRSTCTFSTLISLNAALSA